MGEWTQTVSVTWHQSGQPRPYADSIYEATIEFGTDAEWAQRWDPPESVVLNIARAVMNRGAFVMKDDPDRQWHQTYAEVFKKQEHSKWRVRLVQPYCD